MMFRESHQRLRPLVRIALIAMIGGVLSCHGCFTGPEKPAEQYLEKSATGVVVIPSLGGFADHMQAMIESARSVPGGGWLVKVSADLARRLGFDPLTRAGQKTAGIDPSRSMAFSGIGRSDVLMVLPYSDLKTLDAAITRLFANLGNRPARKTEKKNGYTVVTYATSDSAEPSFAYTTAGGNLLLAGGADPVGLAIAAAARTPDQSLAKAPDYLAAKGRIGARDVYIYNVVPERAALAAIPKEAMLGFSFAAKELALRVNVPLSPEKAKKAAEYFGTGETGLAELPAGQPVYLRGDIDWSKIIADVEPMLKKNHLAAARFSTAQDPMDTARAFFKAGDIDLDQEILGNLTPGFSATIGISPTADLSNALQLDPRRVNPFQNYTLAGIGHVKDPAKAAATMAKLSKLVEKLGAKVTTRQVAGGTVFTASYSLGEGLSWTLRGNEVIVSGGYGDRLEALIASVSKHQQTLQAAQFPPRTAEILFGKQGIAAALDLGKVDQAVKNIKTGEGMRGAGAEMIRSAIGGVLDQLSALRPAIGITPADNGITVDLAVSLQ